MVSIIIPSRSAQWLKQTVESLLSKAEGEVEVIVVYDGRWPEPHEMPPDDPRVIQIHHGEVHNHYGMRASINAGVRISSGEYVMVIDEQCSVSQGYDVRLSQTCQDDWVVIPRRERLDADNWGLTRDTEGDKRPPVDYMKIDFPFAKPLDKTQGLHGSEDRQRYYDRKDTEVDDVMTCQGSCYFMKRTTWDKYFPNGLDDVNYGPFTQEAQEVTMTTWLSGGRVVVDKGCWYAHLHKGKRGKSYGFSNAQYKKHCEQMERGRVYCMNHWLFTKKYKHDFKWLLEKFWPVEGWKDSWERDIIEGMKTDYSSLKYRDDYWLSNLKGQDLSKLGKDDAV